MWIRRVSALTLLLTLLIIGCAKQPTPTPYIGGSLAKPTEFRFVLGTKVYEARDIPMPAKGQSYGDPDFSTVITRITDKSKDKYIGPGIQNEYAKADPENADGTRIILRGNTAAYYLYDANTFKKLRQLKFFDECGQEPEPRWDRYQPSVFYYVCNTKLMMFDVKTNKKQTVHDFKSDVDGVSFVTTKTEGDASVDRRYWCFLAQDKDFKTLAVLVYDKESDSIVGLKDEGFEDDINWVGMDMGGVRCILGYENLDHPDIFSRDFSKKISLVKGSNGHGDFARTAEGRDVLVYQNSATDYIAMSDLETGKETPLVKIPFDVNIDIGLHISGNCEFTPGWVLVSTYGSKRLPPDVEGHSWMDTQLFMLELKKDPRVWRIAHTYAYASDGYESEKNYFAECFAAINTQGSRIYYGSNWADFRPDYSETYRADLPASWQMKMPAQ